MAPSRNWSFPVKWNGYKNVAASESTEATEKFESQRGLLSDSGSDSPRSTDSLEEGERMMSSLRSSKSPRSSRWMTLITLFNCLLFASSVILFLALPHRRSNELNYLLKQVSAYSPVYDKVEIPFVTQRIHGNLFPNEPEKQNIGRLEPGPIADAIWDDLEKQLPHALTREDVIKMGKDPEKAVKLDNDLWGQGEDMYMGTLDIYHVLHCFNSIYQEAFKDYYFDGEKWYMEAYGPHFIPPHRTHNELYWLHLRHCSDIVVSNLMCNADATMMTWTWLETQPIPFPDFSVDRKCRDWNALNDWRNENSLNISHLGEMEKPYDQTKIHPMYWKLYGNETHKGDNRHHPLWD